MDSKLQSVIDGLQEHTDRLKAFLEVCQAHPAEGPVAEWQYETASGIADHIHHEMRYLEHAIKTSRNRVYMDGWTLNKEKGELLIQKHTNGEFVKGTWFSKDINGVAFEFLNSIFEADQ